MNIMELGAIGELVGGIAVIGSLIYVGLQVRQSTRAQNATAVDIGVNWLMTLQQDIAGDPELAQIMYEGGADRTRLQPAQYFRFHLVARSVFLQFEAVRVKWEAGMVHDSLWHTEKAFFHASISAPGIAQWWDTHATDFSPELRSYIAKERQSIGARTVPAQPSDGRTTRLT